MVIPPPPPNCIEVDLVGGENVLLLDRSLYYYGQVTRSSGELVSLLSFKCFNSKADFVTDPGEAIKFFEVDCDLDI